MADKEIYGGANYMDFFKVGNSGAGSVTQEIMQDGGEYVEEIDAASGAKNDAEGSGKRVEQFQFGMYDETKAEFHVRDGIENEE
ncbi:hypothetical protein SLA2020_034170 [Shorea laevis]